MGRLTVDSGDDDKLDCLHVNAEGVLVHVQVQPRASKNELTGLQEGSLKLRLAAPPVEGAANKECIKLLAEMFAIPKSSIEIVQGRKSRRKIVLIKGSTLERVEAVLRQILRGRGCA